MVKVTNGMLQGMRFSAMVNPDPYLPIRVDAVVVMASELLKHRSKEWASSDTASWATVKSWA